jgi:hypothetical protein
VLNMTSMDPDEIFEISIKKLIDVRIDDKDIVIWGDYSNDLHDAENVEIGLAALTSISST